MTPWLFLSASAKGAAMRRHGVKWWVWAIGIAPFIVFASAVAGVFSGAVWAVSEFVDTCAFLWRSLGPDCMRRDASTHSRQDDYIERRRL